MVRRRLGIFRLVFLAPGLIFSTAVFAQTAPVGATPPPASPQSLNPAGLAPQPHRDEQRDVFTAPAPGPCPIAVGNASTFVLRSVNIAGETGATGGADLTKAYQEKIGQSISLGDVCAIRDRAQSILFRRDILARVDVPPQSLSGGQLKLNITVAQISSVIVKGDGGPAVAKVQDYLEHLRGKVFDIAAVQRYLYLASDVPGVHVRATLTPAPAGDGAVDLMVTVSTTLTTLEADVQNYNSHALGRWGGLVRGDLNGLTGWGDRTSVVLYSSLFDDKQQVVQGIEEVRLGDEGVVARASFSYGESRPGAELKPLDLHGSSKVTEVTLSYPLLRARATDLSLSGGIDVVDQRTTVGGVGTLSEDHLRVLFARLAARRHWRTGSFFQTSEWVGNLELRQGLAGLLASHAGNPLLSRNEGIPDAFVIKADSSLTVRWTPAFETYFRAAAQYSGDVLLSYENFAVGNLTIARGYDPSALTGDKGVAGTLELRAWPAPLLPTSDLKRRIGAAQVFGFAFVDSARVENLSTGGLNRSVHSAGGGFDFAVTSRARMTLTYVHPFDRVSPNAPSRPSDRVMLNMSARF